MQKKLSKPNKPSSPRSAPQKTGAEVIVSLLFVETLILITLLSINIVSAFVWLLPIMLPLINSIWYIVWKTGKIKPPYYFAFCILFLVLVYVGFSFDVLPMLAAFLVVALILVSLISIVCKIKHTSCHWSQFSLKQFFSRFTLFFQNNPIAKKRIILHSIILFIAGLITAIFMDARGYWAGVSAVAILAGEDLDVIAKKGVLRMVGAFAGFLIGSCLSLFDFGVVGPIILLIVGFVATLTFLPSDKYALGSAGIGLSAVAIGSLAEGAISGQILLERLVWTIVGAIIVVAVIYIGGKIYSRKLRKQTK